MWKTVICYSEMMELFVMIKSIHYSSYSLKSTYYISWKCALSKYFHLLVKSLRYNNMLLWWVTISIMFVWTSGYQSFHFYNSQRILLQNTLWMLRLVLKHLLHHTVETPCIFHREYRMYKICGYNSWNVLLKHYKLEWLQLRQPYQAGKNIFLLLQLVSFKW